MQPVPDLETILHPIPRVLVGGIALRACLPERAETRALIVREVPEYAEDYDALITLADLESGSSSADAP